MIEQYLFYTIYFLFFISFMIIVIFWNSRLHANPKFRVLLNVLTALTIIFTTLAIIIQLYAFTASQTNAQITNYETLFNILIVDTMHYFEQNPKMNYFYNQMFEPLHYNKNQVIHNRNYPEEQQITFSILQNLSSLIYYLENDITLTEFSKTAIQSKLFSFSRAIIRSPIFIENYNNLAPTLLTPFFKKYFKQNFNV